MELYPDPKFDGEKAWLLVIGKMCIQGGLFHYELDCSPKLKAELINFSYLELHTDTMYCIACNKRLGVLSEEVYNPPLVCLACEKQSFRVKTGLIEFGKLLGFRNPRKAYCYLLEHNLKLRKGICRNFKND